MPCRREVRHETVLVSPHLGIDLWVTRKPCKERTFSSLWAVVRRSRRLVCSTSPGGEGRRGSRRVSRQVELTAQSLWSEVAGRLKGALNDTTYRTWFADAEGVELTDDTLVISVPNDFTREWIEGHFLGLIGAAARDATGH